MNTFKTVYSRLINLQSSILLFGQPCSINREIMLFIVRIKYKICLLLDETLNLTKLSSQHVMLTMVSRTINKDHDVVTIISSVL